MIRSFKELREKAKRLGPKKVAVAAAFDEDVLKAVRDALDEGIAAPILVGPKGRIEEAAKGAGISLEGMEVVETADDIKQMARRAVSLVREGKAEILMKGKLHTAEILRAVLDKEEGLRTGRILSHVYIVEAKKWNKLIFISDGGMIIAPTLEHKVEIVRNAIEVAHALGIEMPKVALLAAVEIVNPDMPATVDAAIITQMARRKQIKGAIVDGPLAMDNAISKRAAEHKGIESPVAGEADILIVPDIEAGNIAAKAIIYFTDCEAAGIIVGAKAPIVLTSRADTAITKFNSIALAVLLAQKP